MAKKKEKKEKASKGDDKGEKKKGMSAKGRFILSMIVLAGLIFLPTAMLLFVGMMPALVATFFSARGLGARASTVFAMNMAGCVPFIFKLWSSGNDFEASVDIIADSQTLMVMYTAAAFGYLIDWVITGLVSSFLYQKGVKRMKSIRKRQKLLVERWGMKVAGAVDVSWIKKKK